MTMWVKVGNKKSVEIHDEVVRGVLNIYPEEKLEDRPIFAESFSNGYISYKSLLDECDSLLIPWQMFFLNPSNFKKQLENIENNRKSRFRKSFFTKRESAGKITSKRIIDRLIQLQDYIINNYKDKLSKHTFCGSMKGKAVDECIKIFIESFDINMSEFRGKSRFDIALEYLIEKIENKTINISRGVLKGGVLPEFKGTGNVYKNTSGFVVRDEYIPFIFLPDDLNPDEALGRRIYTLVYLLVCIGLDEYDFYLESNFKASALKTKGSEAKRHKITTAILLPEAETERLRGSIITETEIENLSKTYKITPTAVVVTLKRRGIINQTQYESLLPVFVGLSKNKSKGRRPNIDTAVRKFCGLQSFGYVNQGIKNGTLGGIEAQYLLFGRVNQKQYKNYRQKVNI